MNEQFLFENSQKSTKLELLDDRFRKEQLNYSVWLYIIIAISILVCAPFSFSFLGLVHHEIKLETFIPLGISILFISQFFLELWAIKRKSPLASKLAICLMCLNTILTLAAITYFGAHLIYRIRNPPTSESESIGEAISMFITITGFIIFFVQIITISGARKTADHLQEREILKGSCDIPTTL